MNYNYSFYFPTLNSVWNIAGTYKSMLNEVNHKINEHHDGSQIKTIVNGQENNHNNSTVCLHIIRTLHLSLSQIITLVLEIYFTSFDMIIWKYKNLIKKKSLSWFLYNSKQIVKLLWFFNKTYLSWKMANVGLQQY